MKVMPRRFMLLVLMLFPIVAAAGQSFHNCGSSDPSLNASSATVICADFETGIWAETNIDWPADGSPGVQHTANLGWGMGVFYPNADGSCCSNNGINGQGFNLPVIPNFAVSGQGAGSTWAATTGPWTTCSNGNDAMNGWHNFSTGPGNGGPGETDIFYRGMVKYDPTTTTFGHQKMFGIDRTAGNNYLLSQLYNDSSTGQLHGMTMQMQGGTGSPTWNNVLNARNDDWLIPNLGVPDLTMVVGRWYYTEQHLKINTLTPTGANTDGVWEFWMDDCGTDGVCPTGTPTKRSSWTNIVYRTNAPGANQIPTAVFGAVFVEAFSNACTVGKAYYDNIAVVTPAYCPGRTSGQPCIGFPGVSTNPTPPAAPQGLTVVEVRREE